MAAVAQIPQQEAAQAASHFRADVLIERAARESGYTRIRRQPVVIVDEKVLSKELFHLTPDYSTIRRLLLDGRIVPGAELGDDLIYTLQRPEPR